MKAALLILLTATLFIPAVMAMKKMRRRKAKKAEALLSFRARLIDYEREQKTREMIW